MFYAYKYLTTATLTEENAYEMPMPLTPGVIHQVDVLFQDGCDHEVFVQIWDKNFQVWPSNRGGNLTGNATVISFREFYEITSGNPKLTAKIWTTLAADFKEVIIQLGLLPKRIIQPLSFDELLAAAQGIE